MSIILGGFFGGIGVVVGVVITCLIIEGIEALKAKFKKD